MGYNIELDKREIQLIKELYVWLDGFIAGVDTMYDATEGEWPHFLSGKHLVVLEKIKDGET